MKTLITLWLLLVAVFLVGCTQGSIPTAQHATSMTGMTPAVAREIEATNRPDAPGSPSRSPQNGTVAPAPLILPTPLGSPAPATGSGRVAATGRMAIARASHTATLLPGGWVLVAGGCTLSSCEMSNDGATAELFDPAKRIFIITGSMTTARVGHTATLLPSGKVLIVGGFSQDHVLASAELYDPATGTFTATGSMSARRADHSTTVLPGGQILIVGGFDGSARLVSAEMYDPETGTFTTAGEMQQPRGGHVAAVLADGRLLIAGGSSAAEDVLATAEIYDPTAGTFSRTGDMTVVRHKHAGAVLRDGTVLIVGGSDVRDGFGRYTSTEIYDPTAGTFHPGASMAAPRYKLSGAITALPTGDVVVGGGDEYVEVYTHALDSFRTAEGSVDASLAFATTTLLGDGRVLIVGGYDARINPTAGAWMYAPLG